MVQIFSINPALEVIDASAVPVMDSLQGCQVCTTYGTV